ncbi:hypothetical protein Tco_1426603 [Tanacetum coccineum]
METEEQVPVIKVGDQDEGQAGSNPSDATESQPQPSHVVHVVPNLEHTDLETTDASTQQKPKQIDEEFTTTAYPNVQENHKLLTEDHVILEEPASSTGTLSSLQNLNKDISFIDQFFMEKPQEEEPGKTNAEVSKVVDEIVTDTVDWAMQAPLRARFRDLPTVDIKEILQQRMFEDNTYKTHEVHNDLSAQQQGGKTPSSSKTTASASQFMAWMTSDTQYESVDIPRAQKLSPTDYLMQDDSIPRRAYWWKPLPEEERPATPESAWTIPSFNKSDVMNNWASALATTYEAPAENSMLAKIGDMTTFLKWYCRQVNKTMLTQADFERRAYEVVKSFYPYVIHLQFQMEECHKILTAQIDCTNPEGDNVRIDVNRLLTLGGPPGHAVFLLSYLDFGLELLVPEQMWIDDVYTYDISAKYGISHWWFNQQKFYIERHDSPSRRKDVRTHMRILSVVRIKAYSRYRYDYLSEIVLRIADFQEHTIAKKDFKNMYPSNFEDLNLLLLKGHLDHLPRLNKQMISTAVKLWTRNLVIRQWVEDFQLDIESYQTQLNLTKPGWDATGYEFKHDYTIIESPRSVVFSVNNNE